MNTHLPVVLTDEATTTTLDEPVETREPEPTAGLAAPPTVTEPEKNIQVKPMQFTLWYDPSCSLG